MSQSDQMLQGNDLFRPLPSLIALTDPASVSAEQYRILYTRLLQIRKTRPLQVIGITSAIQREGKTTVAFNLAITMAKTFNIKTLLIEADIKKPAFHSMLNSSNGTGLANALAGGEDTPSLLQFAFDGRLAILTAGSVTEQTAALFSPERLQAVVKSLREPFEFILMDAPPVLPLADMNILSEVVDGILLVVQADRTPRSFVSRALTMLPPPKVSGLVLNNLKTPAPSSYYYYTYYFQARS